MKVQNLKRLRLVHRYLGYFFSPLIILFAYSGVVLVLDLHKDDRESGYMSNLTYYTIARLHEKQRLPTRLSSDKPKSSAPLKFIVVLMGVAIMISSIIGIGLGFAHTKHRLTLLAVITIGTGLPIFLLYLGGGG